MRIAIFLFLLFSTSVVVADISKEITCLAHNIYYESRNQSISAQFAVASVTLNRVKSSKFPNTICKVVEQKDQFAWFWDGKSDKPIERKAYLRAMEVALLALSERFTGNVKGALYYHSVKIKPKWAKHLKFLIRIEDHLFYK